MFIKCPNCDESVEVCFTVDFDSDENGSVLNFEDSSFFVSESEEIEEECNKCNTVFSFVAYKEIKIDLWEFKMIKSPKIESQDEEDEIAFIDRFTTPLFSKEEYIKKSS